MAKTVTISSKGQITLPKDLRERYHLHEGETAIALPTDDGILIKHHRVRLRGLWAGRLKLTKVEEEIRRLRQEWTL